MLAGKSVQSRIDFYRKECRIYLLLLILHKIKIWHLITSLDDVDFEELATNKEKEGFASFVNFPISYLWNYRPGFLRKLRS